MGKSCLRFLDRLTITMQSLIRVAHVQQNFRTIREGWISIDNRRGSVPDLLANICRPAIQCLTSDDLARVPLVDDLSPRLAGICAVRVKGRYEGA